MEDIESEIFNNYNFSELDIVQYSYVELSEDLIVPIKVDIANINFSNGKTNAMILKITEDTISTYNPFLEDITKNIEKEELTRLFNHIDYSMPCMEGICNSSDFYDYVYSSGMCLADLTEIKNEIVRCINNVTSIFNRRLIRLLDIKPNKIRNRVGGIIDKIDINNYDLNQTQEYFKLQGFIEFFKVPIFKENIGRALNEFSYREIQTRLQYFSRKFTIEKEQKAMEYDAMPKPNED